MFTIHCLTPILQRSAFSGPSISAAVQRVTLPSADASHATAVSAPRMSSKRIAANGNDSVWNGLLIGAAIGAGGGYFWARSQCGARRTLEIATIYCDVVFLSLLVFYFYVLGFQLSICSARLRRVLLMSLRRSPCPAMTKTRGFPVHGRRT
jgi:hypothetical protein